jgi:ABC-type uncharacterized transport system permease subunit
MPELLASRRVRWALTILLPPLAVAVALAIASGLIAASGHSVPHAFSALFDGAFGNRNNLGNTMTKVTPLVILGLGIIIGIRAGLWNLGGDGQITMGGLGAIFVGLYVVESFPNYVAAPLVLIGGFVAGGLWGGIAGVLKAKRGITEVITTLLLNFVAFNVVKLLIERPPLLDTQAGFPQSRAIKADLPIILGGSQAHAGLILGLVLIGIVWLLISRTSFGLELRAVGLSVEAARVAGIRRSRRIFQAMVISGGFAGVAGASEVLGLQHHLIADLSPGYGFTAFAVALLAAADPLLLLPSAVFFGALLSGGPLMEQQAGVPIEIVYATQGLTILLVVAAFALRSRLLRGLSIGAIAPPSPVTTISEEVAAG